MTDFNEFKKQKLAEHAAKYKGSADAALPSGVLRAISAAEEGRNITTPTVADLDKNSIIIPNPRNYDNFNDFKNAALGARSGRLAFSSGAYNHGVDSDYISSLMADVDSFVSRQSEAISNNKFGDVSTINAAKEESNVLKERLAKVWMYRQSNADWLRENGYTSGSYKDATAPIDQGVRRMIELKSGDVSGNFSSNKYETKSPLIEQTDALISEIQSRLDLVDDAWENERVKYAQFGGDEEKYNLALMYAQHDYDTYEEVQAALANPGRTSRMSADEFEYLSNYGLKHGYSRPEEYDKEIAALREKLSTKQAAADKRYSDILDGGEITDNIYVEEIADIKANLSSLEYERDALANEIAAWSAYTPLFNAEDFDAMSKYAGEGHGLYKIVNEIDTFSTDNKQALITEMENELLGEPENSLKGELARFYRSIFDSTEAIDAAETVLLSSQMDDDEIAMFNYVYNTQGEEAAKVFFDSITGILERRRTEERNRKQVEWASKNAFNATAASVLSLGTNVLAGAAAPAQALADLFGEKEMSEDLDLPATITSNFRSGAGQYVSEDLFGGLGGVGEFGYNAVMSIADMFVARKLTGLKTKSADPQKISKVMTQLVMSSEAASSAMYNAHQRGIEGTEAVLLGVGTGLIEAVTEKYSIDALISQPKTALKHLFKNVVTEGSEEAAAEVLGDILDIAVSGDKSEIKSRYNELLRSGMTTKEASRAVLIENLQRIGVSAAAGALAGGLQSAPSAIGFAKDSYATGKVIKEQGDVQHVINEALKLGADSGAYKLALKLQETVSNGKTVSNNALGNLLSAGGEDFIAAYNAHLESKENLKAYETGIRETENAAEAVREDFVGEAEEEMPAQAENEPIINSESAGMTFGNDPAKRVSVSVDILEGSAKERANGVLNVAATLGRRVSFYAKPADANGKIENGYRDRSTGEIHVNVYAKNPYTVVFGHELAHSVEMAKSYSLLQTAVEKYLAKEFGAGEFGRRTNEILISRRGTQYAVGLEGARAEVVANFVSEHFFSDEAAVAKFVSENRSLGQKILETVRGMLRKITKGHAGYGTLKDVERLFYKALVQTQKSAKATEKTSGSENIFRGEEFAKANADWEARAEELRQQYREGKITAEEFDELWEKDVESDSAYKSEMDNAATDIMGYTDERNAEVNQEKQFSLGDVQWSIGETTDGRFVAIVDSDILENIDTSSWDQTKKEAAKKAASKALKQFSNGIVVNGITRKVNKISRNEYTRSNDTERLYKYMPDVFADKLRAAEVVDDIVVAATNWSRDGFLKHSREDSFIDFDHGDTLIASGDAKYSAEVVVGITNTGEAVFYNVVDMTPTTFEIKKADSLSNATTQNAIGAIQEESAGDSISHFPDSVNNQFSVKRKSSKGQALDLEYENSQQPTSEMLLDSNATNHSITNSESKVNGQFSVSDDPTHAAASMQNAIFRAGVKEKLVKGEDSDENMLAATEAQREQLMEARLNSEPPADDVLRSYIEGGVEIPSDPNEGYWVGYNYAHDAVAALAQGKLSKKTGVKLAELLGMPVVDDEVVVPFRTWFILNDLGTYERRDTGETVPVAGYALPVVNQSGLWIHYYDADSNSHVNDFFKWDEITRTKAQHIPSYAEWNSYLRFLEDGGRALLPENFAPTAKDLRDWEARERDNTFMNDDEFYAASGVYEKMSPNTQRYVNSTLRDFRMKLANIFSIPRSRGDRTEILEAADSLAADAINNGSFSKKRSDAIFNRLMDESFEIDNEFYEQYKGVLPELRTTKMVISQEDARDLEGGLDGFRKRAFGRVMGVSARKDKSAMTVDAFYQQLTGKYPELFSADITHPVEQLEKMLEVSKEISDAKDMIINPSEFTRDVAYEQYKEALGAMLRNMQNATRVTVQEQNDAALASKEFEDELRDIMETGKKLPALMRAITKQSYKVLLTQHDQSVVGDLLSGYVTEDAVRTSEANAVEIISMYRVRKPYEEAYARIQEFRRKVVKRNREIAANVVGDVTLWNDKGNIFYNIVDLPRIIDEIAPDEKTAQLFKDTYITPLKKNNAKAERYIEDVRKRVKTLNLSRKVNKGDAVSESAVVQLLGEARAAQSWLRYMMEKEPKKAHSLERDGYKLEEWIQDEAVIWEKNPSLNNEKSRAKIEAAVEEFRKIYDKILDDMNMALVKEGLAPIAKRAGYFPHFSKEQRTGIFSKVRRLFGIRNDIESLPTEIAGITGDFKPNRQWFSNAMSRNVNSREAQLENVLYDAVEGLDKYIEVASNLIHHTQDITRFRALERYIRTESASDAVKREIMRIEADMKLSEDEKNEAIASRVKGQRYALSGFAQMLLEYTNKLAGKKSIIDRGVEALFGRDVYNITKGVMKKYGVNATSSLSSALTNFLPLAQGSNGYSHKDFVLAIADLARGEAVVDESSFVVARMGSDRLVKTKIEWLGDKSRFLFELIDKLVSNVAVQARYRHNIGKGLSHETALNEADAWAGALIGDRSTGGQPLIFESNNPVWKALSQFQFEVNNQMLRAFMDMPREARQIWSERGNAAEGAYRLSTYFAKSAIYTWLLNGVMEKIVGRGPGGDWLGIIFEAIATGAGWDFFEKLAFDDEDDEGEGVAAGIGSLFYNAAQEVPFVGSLLGGGRIPISSVIPDVPYLYKTFIDKDISWQSKLTTGFSELSTPILYLTLPFGASQIKKSGIGFYDAIRGGSYTYDKNGSKRLKYPNVGAWEKIQSTVFGTTATEGGREWVESGFDTLSAKATKAYEGALEAGATKREAYDLVKELSSLKNDEGEGASDLQKTKFLDASDVSDAVKCAVYFDMVASDNKDSEITEKKVMDELMRSGVDMGELYRTVSGLRRVAGESKEAHENEEDYEKQKESVAVLSASTLSIEAIEKLYVARVSKNIYDKMTDAGIDEAKSRAIAYDMGLLVPGEGKKTVSDIQKMRVVLNADLGELEAGALAAVANDSTEKKMTLAGDYEVSAEAYVRMKEYVAMINDNSNISQDEAEEAIDSLSDNFIAQMPGVPGSAPMNLTRSQKAVLWQICNKSWKPSKNPYSTSVGRKVAEVMAEWDE